MFRRSAGYWQGHRSVLRSSIGPELVSNGGFAADTDWTKSGLTVTISDGEAHFAATLDGDNIQQALTFEPGKRYAVRFLVSNFVAGSITPRLSDDAIGAAAAANGFVSQYIVATASSDRAAGVCGVDA